MALSVETRVGGVPTPPRLQAGMPPAVTTLLAPLDDSQLKVRELADMVGISKSAVHRILTENLDMRKLCARWVPRLLTMGQKQRREDVSIESLAMFRSNKAAFLRRFITMDETWVHHFTPETKEQSKQWTERGESAPKKEKTVPAAGKVMASVFLDTPRKSNQRQVLCELIAALE
ncbi:uncharacterized protein LOC111631292 [Centruroides sculpturatus]|uniref:uncharacterized protein LOC111631292 n=1 Tax=Centruroides sculpturatus TaxID=218467 RepID=UPI000C6DB87D|nr:uncharacterized protein LOC111631292 [Centruroides sculpturatus]